MNRKEIIGIIASDAISLALNVSTYTPTAEELAEAYISEMKDKDAAKTQFLAKIRSIAPIIESENSVIVTAKAAAYDKIKSRINSFVQQLTNGQNYVPDEKVLNDTIEKLIRVFNSNDNTQKQTAALLMQPIAYARKLEQQIVSKDNELAAKNAEIEQLKQQLAAKEAEVADLTSKLSVGVGASK